MNNPKFYDIPSDLDNAKVIEIVQAQFPGCRAEVWPGDWADRCSLVVHDLPDSDSEDVLLALEDEYPED